MTKFSWKPLDAGQGARSETQNAVLRFFSTQSAGPRHYNRLPLLMLLHDGLRPAVDWDEANVSSDAKRQRYVMAPKEGQGPGHLFST